LLTSASGKETALPLVDSPPDAGVIEHATTERPKLLSVRGLKKHFVKKSVLPWQPTVAIRAVDGIDLDVAPGEVVGLVGESGCGKTTVGRLLVGLEEPTDGEILFDGVDLTRLRGASLKEHRRRIQMIFQDPYSSLDPRMRIRDSVAEPLTVNGIGTRAERMEKVASLLQQVGLDPSFGDRLPSQLSGGQRQRVVIARALALSPEIIVADEPTSSLDVSVRAQVINLLRSLQRRSGLSFIFVSHDLATVRYICDTISVMYLGRIVERGPAEELFHNSLHPYTKALLSAVPVPDPAIESQREEQVLSGELPSPANPPPGCTFHTRCPLATERCKAEAPALTSYGPGRSASCHYIQL
jgi:oligopeptide/dipeptide ABC transporter ATP-binding protein